MNDDPAVLAQAGGQVMLGGLTEHHLCGISRLLVGRDSGTVTAGEWRSAESDGRYQAVVRWDGSRYEAWSAILQDNVDGFRPSVITEDPTTVVRVLAYELSDAWRQRHGFASFLLPIGKAEVPSDVSIDSSRPTTVTWRDADREMSATLGNRNLVVAFSNFARCSITEIATSIKSPDGSPLFSPWI